MKYKAVIFDLFGTLVGNFSPGVYERAITEIASAVSAPGRDFVQLWSDTSDERMMGTIQSPEGIIRHVCQLLDIHPTDAQIKLACEIRFSLTRRQMSIRPDAIAVLSQLKSSGYKTGLLTNCTAEAATIWKEMPLAPLVDVTVFSCLEGMQKPDPRIYELTTKRLGVMPRDSLFIADGMNRELAGAAQVGIHPVLINPPSDDGYGLQREEWDGPAISSLNEVLTLLG